MPQVLVSSYWWNASHFDFDELQSYTTKDWVLGTGDWLDKTYANLQFSILNSQSPLSPPGRLKRLGGSILSNGSADKSLGSG